MADLTVRALDRARVAPADAMELRVQHALPSAVTDLASDQLAAALGGPTLFDLRRRGEPPLFVSVLVHGNEPSGWLAVRRLRRQLTGASVVLFVGNVEAARLGVRALPGRPDFNRVWEGGEPPEATVAAQVTDYAAAARPRLAVDIHNNTGRNPPYSVIARRDARTLAFAGAFAEHAMLATEPPGFQTGRFARFCPAVTIEVGTADDAASADRASAFLRRVLDANAPMPTPSPLRLFEAVARVTVSEDAVIVPEAQRFNFRMAPAGAVLSRRGALTARAADGTDMGKVYFRHAHGTTVLKRPSVIAMYTGDFEAARRDCLCYLLERSPAPA